MYNCHLCVHSKPMINHLHFFSIYILFICISYGYSSHKTFNYSLHKCKLGLMKPLTAAPQPHCMKFVCITHTHNTLMITILSQYFPFSFPYAHKLFSFFPANGSVCSWHELLLLLLLQTHILENTLIDSQQRINHLSCWG